MSKKFKVNYYGIKNLTLFILFYIVMTFAYSTVMFNNLGYSHNIGKKSCNSVNSVDNHISLNHINNHQILTYHHHTKFRILINYIKITKVISNKTIKL